MQSSISEFHSNIKVCHDEIEAIFFNAIEGKIFSPCHNEVQC
jgi:hypothetical protein